MTRDMDTTGSAPTPDGSLRRTALAVSMTSSFLTPFMGSGINVAMPFIAKEFGLSAVAIGWVVTAYMLAAAMFLVPFGRLADLVGRKRIFALGLGVNIVGPALAALAPSALFLILGRAVQGIGGGRRFGGGAPPPTPAHTARGPRRRPRLRT